MHFICLLNIVIHQGVFGLVRDELFAWTGHQMKQDQFGKRQGQLNAKLQILRRRDQGQAQHSARGLLYRLVESNRIAPAS